MLDIALNFLKEIAEKKEKIKKKKYPET